MAFLRVKRYYAEGKLLATRTGALLTYVQSDHLGSTSTLTDASGSVIARERYSAFGERRRGEMPLTTDQLYTSQQYNSLSGLYHYSDGKSAGRFYDPLLARFVMADSITPGKGSIALNRYAYANDSPIVFSDPTGHAVWSEKDGPAYETHEQLIDAVGAYDTPSEVRWTGIYSEAYPNYAPPMSEPDRNYGYRLKVWQWQTQKEADAAQASGAGADWSKVGSNLLTGVSLAAGVVASNGGDNGNQKPAGSVTGYIGPERQLTYQNGYPSILDPRTAEPIPFPEGNLVRTDPTTRVSWTAKERAAFIKEWYDRGYATPPGGWGGDATAVHHIHPRALGGTNEFENLVPVSPTDHKLFNDFWKTWGDR